MRVLAFLNSQIDKQYGAWLPWIAVGFGVGVALYFSLRFEPNVWVVFAGLACSMIGVILALGFRAVFGVFPVFVMTCGVGFSWAALNAHWHEAPRLTFHYYGPIYGRVVDIDRSGSHALRLTLDEVLLSDVPFQETPTRVRVSLHGYQDWFDPMPGQFVGLTGHLSAPNGPVEPRGFDFQRHAWFLRLGAVGYTRTPVLEMKPPDREKAIDRLRYQISARVAGHLGGDVGGFAAAVTTGDRSAFSQEGLQSLRVSNLAHLLAISGLHMGLLAAFLFGVIRFGLSLWQPLALRLPVKKLAAVAALFGATGYLLLSGASIATQRAYIMAAVALVAICLDRRALTLRAVAIAALIVMIIRPYSLLSPGFQMSFSATAALVFVFSQIRDLPEAGLKRWQTNVLSLVLSSFVAGIATAPFAAAHFNQWAAYGLLANVMAVPVMGTIVIPGAVLAAILAPMGWEVLGLEVMGLGLRWILWVAHWVSALEGARIPVVTPQSFVLPLIALSGCWLILWQGVGRFLGAIGLCTAMLAWTHAERPDVLISDQGQLVGVMQDGQRALSKPKGQGFVARTWLENDGDAASQAEAATRGDSASGPIFTASLGQYAVVHLKGKRGFQAFESCASDEILVSDQMLEQELQCRFFDRERLSHTGSVALWLNDERLEIETVAEKRGQRLWSPPEQLLNQ
ncbi:MAG: ComEC/Rec2 family competence protein [Pseudomonadota bacterium]|nr:ComEC/Rec2 family competence protein [Pseudomonadota bacterium]